MELTKLMGIEFYCLHYKPEDPSFHVECLEGMSERAVCGLCLGPIADRYIMQVTDTTYHERCLICSACGIPLAGTCFARDSKLYCRIDYDRLFAKRCLGCSERICPGEMVMRTHSDGAQLFHLRCFQCVVCGAQLQKGDQFVVKQGQLFCRPDYEKELEMFRSIPQGCEDLSGEETCGRKDGRKGPKRPRTILTTQQRRAFKASFEISPKPCRKVREGLAKDTGLSVRIVQVWFQNQRAKMKKMQKKGKLDPKNSNEIKELEVEVKQEKLKEEDHSSQGSVYSNYMGAEGRYSSQEESPETAFYRNILTAHQPPFNNNPGEGGWKMEGIGGGLLHPQMTPLPSNPIDRLYSMQNSYFCPEEEQPLAYANS